MNIYKAVPGEPLPLGRRWENNALRVVFDISAWVDAFGAGTVRLLHQRQGDAAPYPVSVTRTDADGTENDETGTLVLWDVSNADTAQVCHFGRAELRYYAGREGAEEFLAKSDIWKTEVLDALGGAQADAPEAQREWLDELLEAADGIEANVAAAEAAQEAAQEAAETAQAVATRIDNQFFYIDWDLTSETYGHLMWVHDSNTHYDPELPRVIAYGDEWRLDSSGVLTITHAGPLNALPDLGDYDTALRHVALEGVTSIGNNIFSGRNQLVSITIPDSVTSIGDYAFYYCSSLTSVTIPDSVTSIGDHAFLGCQRLASLTIGNSVTSIGVYAFAFCSAPTVTIPDSVTSIGDYAFQSCSALTVTIGNSVTSIGSSAFNYCTRMNNLTIGNSVTSIGADAFRSCSSLTSVTIPDSVTSISLYTFQSCSALTSLTIGNSVTSIFYSAFRDCSALTDVYYKGSEEQRNAINIAGENDPLTQATWHYNWEG